MKILGAYKPFPGDDPDKGIIADRRLFVTANIQALLREVLPAESAKPVTFHFLPDVSAVGGIRTHVFHLINSQGRIEMALREPDSIIKEKGHPVPSLWWMCYRAVRGYMVYSGLLKREQLLPFALYEKFGLSHLGKNICDQFTSLDYSHRELEFHIDANLVSNVIMKRLTQAKLRGQDVCPIADFGPLLLVTRFDYKKLL